MTTTLPKWATLSDFPPGRRELRFPFGAGELVLEIVGDIPSWGEALVRSLVELLRLDQNWDSYGGIPLDPNCAAAAFEWALNSWPADFPIPAVIPTSGGGLQLEWHQGGIDLEIEFQSGTRMCGFFEDQVSGESWERDLTFDRQPLVDAISRLSRRK